MQECCSTGPIRAFFRDRTSQALLENACEAWPVKSGL
jgi:hypothetical protein